MAEVIVRMKIYVEEQEKLEHVEKTIKEENKVGELKVEEMGFGIKFIRTTLVVDEDEGMDKTEEKIKAIDGVSQVEIEAVDRAL